MNKPICCLWCGRTKADHKEDCPGDRDPLEMEKAIDQMILIERIRWHLVTDSITQVLRDRMITFHLDIAAP